MNTQAEVCPKIKNKLRTITRAEILIRKIRDIYLILVHRFKYLWKQNLSDFSLVIRRWKSLKQARHVRRRCIDSWMKE